MKEEFIGKYEIVYYSKPNGREPLREFLESLSPKLSSEAFSDLVTLQEMGPSCACHIRAISERGFSS